MTFEYKCRICGEIHRGVPSIGPDAPAYYDEVPEEEREDRCRLGADDRVVDDRFFFVRGRLELPVHGLQQPFTWLVWCSLREGRYTNFVETYHDPVRAHVGLFFGWLDSALPYDETTINLKTSVHICDDGARPIIELEATGYSLAVEQREGISQARLTEIVAIISDPSDELVSAGTAGWQDRLRQFFKRG